MKVRIFQKECQTQTPLLIWDQRGIKPATSWVGEEGETASAARINPQRVLCWSFLFCSIHKRRQPPKVYNPGIL